MRRPWQVWLLFLAGLAVVIPAMAWLSWQVLYLDQAEALSRRQAEREELIGRALWRMDSLVTPLLAREAARPDVYYETVLPAAAEPKNREGSKVSANEPGLQLEDLTTQLEAKKQVDAALCLSPLVSEPSDYVMLYFNWLPDNRVLSPQCPSSDERTFVRTKGVTDQELTLYETRRQQLEVSSSNNSLLAMLPSESFPVSRWDYLSDQADAAGPPATNWYSPRGGGVSPSLPQISNGSQQPPPREPPAPVVNEVPQQQAYPSQPQAAPVPQRTYDAPAPSAFTTTGTAQESPPPQQLVDNRRGQNQGKSQRGFGKDDFEQRNSAYQQFTKESVERFKTNNPDGIHLDKVQPPMPYREGAFRPIWINGKLLFARRVQKGEQLLVQGCWLNWNQIEQRLREEVSDILPKFLLVPVFDPRQAALNRVLATLPVQIEVPPLQPQSIQWTPVRVALVVAWAGLVLAALAAAVTLQGMIILNERRASFVSAVTHELRTPLTTFRMYAEMLAEGMVPDPAQQKKYLTTLRTESDRLAHLVDNVLQYARLERGRPGKQRQKVQLGALLERVESRLADRAQQAGLEWRLDGNQQVRKVELSTDPAAVDQILFNLVDNAGKYATQAEDKRLHLSWKLEPRMLALRVIDHGPGIATQGRPRLFLPFSKSVNEAAESAPGVGLGLALSRRLARTLGGELTWEQTPGGGATFCLRLPRG